MLTSRTLTVPAGRDAGAEIPVTTITGARPGPALALVAGNHGYEYPPILALQRVLTELDPAALSGTAILVHVANMPSFLGRTVYFSPIDGKNLNRCYPGDAAGTVSERIAHAITTEVIDACDVLLDLHCGDGNESLRPYVYQTVSGNAGLDARIARLTLAFGIDHIVVDRDRPKDPSRSVYCSNTAITRGKPAITIESGALGRTDAASVDLIVNGIRGVMRELGMLAEGPAALSRPVFLDPVEVLTSPVTGILYPHVAPDAEVTQGTLLAHITDFFGSTIAEVRAPFDGVVLYVVATPPMVQGQPVACVGRRTAAQA